MWYQLHQHTTFIDWYEVNQHLESIRSHTITPPNLLHKYNLIKGSRLQTLYQPILRSNHIIIPSVETTIPYHLIQNLTTITNHQHQFLIAESYANLDAHLDAHLNAHVDAHLEAHSDSHSDEIIRIDEERIDDSEEITLSDRCTEEKEDFSVIETFDNGVVNSHTCVQILRSGKNKGNMCGKKTMKGSNFCGRHTSK